MKPSLSYLPCLGAALASAGPIVLFCLAAAAVGGLIARLHQRLRFLEQETLFLRQRLDKLEKQSGQL